MWSVTEQNHLHYPAVMFHRFRLARWWPPTHFCASTSLPLLLHVSVFSKCGYERLLGTQCLFLKEAFFFFFHHRFFCLFYSFHQFISCFFFHLSLLCQNFIASSFFGVHTRLYFFSFCCALRCVCMCCSGCSSLTFMNFSVFWYQISAVCCFSYEFFPFLSALKLSIF